MSYVIAAAMMLTGLALFLVGIIGLVGAIVGSIFR